MDAGRTQVHAVRCPGATIRCNEIPAAPPPGPAQCRSPEAAQHRQPASGAPQRHARGAAQQHGPSAAGPHAPPRSPVRGSAARRQRTVRISRSSLSSPLAAQPTSRLYSVGAPQLTRGTTPSGRAAPPDPMSALGAPKGGTVTTVRADRRQVPAGHGRGVDREEQRLQGPGMHAARGDRCLANREVRRPDRGESGAGRCRNHPGSRLVPAQLPAMHPVDRPERPRRRDLRQRELQRTVAP